MSWKHDDHVSFRVLIIVGGPAFVLTNYTFYLIVHQVALVVMTACICATVLGVTGMVTRHVPNSRQLGIDARWWRRVSRRADRPAVVQRRVVRGEVIESHRTPRGEVVTRRAVPATSERRQLPRPR